jgi:hypothetical protein
MAEPETGSPLSTREFGSRPLPAFGVGFVFAVLPAGMAVAISAIAIVFTRDANSVVSVIQDEDPEHVRTVFAAAGIELTEQ